MSSAELAVVPTSSRAKMPRTWKFFGTALWGALAFLAMSAGQLIAILIAVNLNGAGGINEQSIKAVAGHGAVVAGSVLLGLPAALTVLWLATRLARRSFASYLALRRPLAKEIVFGLAASAVLLVALDVIAWFAGYPLSPDFALDSVRSARDSGTVWLVMLGFCVGAPIAEEFIFRGFVFRGWSATFLGPVGAIGLSSALFAVIHQQYDWFYIAGIFLIGALFGYLRYRFGSTWLTVITHAFYNLMAGLQALWLIN
ncbi:CPBP family intramembrane glutamic endopeptidase [Bradyrhizobium sp. LHD-71]|uniref:CPBP family intramembrane glutamic endopeptidase n=1 Tax=Bradyrhizobium sp. LHD-71 TaxID=3072141 RepID=UPI00280E242C|nr:CPBP family intramembrane glutamic endopeptidase [Bradyrhizobium sp. LHD-71]MDQ8726250.1 CPBP family intramembrane glutamic endopeptidase [Bradyrhizobium sp. LHD-71]